jgi:hypothetical protein
MKSRVFLAEIIKGNVNVFPAFYETKRAITVFKSQPSVILSTSRFVLIFYPLLRLGLFIIRCLGLSKNAFKTKALCNISYYLRFLYRLVIKISKFTSKAVFTCTP